MGYFNEEDDDDSSTMHIDVDVFYGDVGHALNVRINIDCNN